MNLGADDYLTKPVANNDLVQAIEARLSRSARQAKREFKPDFSSAEPLVKLGLTPRAAEALLWLGPRQDEPGHRHDSRHHRVHREKARAGNLRKTRG